MATKKHENGATEAAPVGLEERVASLEKSVSGVSAVVRKIKHLLNHVMGHDVDKVKEGKVRVGLLVLVGVVSFAVVSFAATIWDISSTQYGTAKVESTGGKATMTVDNLTVSGAFSSTNSAGNYAVADAVVSNGANTLMAQKDTVVSNGLDARLVAADVIVSNAAAVRFAAADVVVSNGLDARLVAADIVVSNAAAVRFAAADVVVSNGLDARLVAADVVVSNQVIAGDLVVSNQVLTATALRPLGFTGLTTNLSIASTTNFWAFYNGIVTQVYYNVTPW